MVLTGSGDQDWIDVDTDDSVPPCKQRRPNSAWSAPSIEDSGVAWNKDIQKSCLTLEINSLCSERSKTANVPLRVSRFVIGQPARRDLFLIHAVRLDATGGDMACMVLSLRPWSTLQMTPD